MHHPHLLLMDGVESPGSHGMLLLSTQALQANELLTLLPCIKQHTMLSGPKTLAETCEWSSNQSLT